MAASDSAPFRLNSLSGGPTHVFELESGDANTKSAVYARKDGVRVKWDEDFGWSARDEKNQALLILVWGVPASKQGDAPPEGVWVTRKGDASYVYDMKFGVSAADKKAQAQRYREAIGGVEM